MFSYSWSFHSKQTGSSLPANHPLYSPAFIFLLMPPTLLVMPSLMFLLIQIWPSSKTKIGLSISWILPDHPGLLPIFPSRRYYSVHCLYMPFSNCIISFIKLIFLSPGFSLQKVVCFCALLYLLVPTICLVLHLTHSWYSTNIRLMENTGSSILFLMKTNSCFKGM